MYTDIVTELNAGMATVCVLTGEAMEEEIGDNNIKPGFTFKSVKEMFNVIC